MNQRPFVEPVACSPAEFPADPQHPEGMKSVNLADSFGEHIDFFPQVEYVERDGVKRYLQIMVPTEGEHWPLILYVQGSAWFTQNVYDHMPELLRMCERGYAVAIVQYRSSDIAPFPAQAEDAKTALRFMRAHAKQYRIDKERVAVWGDSSGGHTALLAGFAADTDCFNTAPYSEQADSVRCIVDWFGPTDLGAMNEAPSTMFHLPAESPEGQLIGGKDLRDYPDEIDATKPANFLSADRATPPTLIMHGNKDRLVSFDQSCRLYNIMKEMGKTVEFIRLENADHGFFGFQAEAALDLVEAFLKKYL